MRIIKKKNQQQIMEDFRCIFMKYASETFSVMQKLRGYKYKKIFVAFIHPKNAFADQTMLCRALVLYMVHDQLTVVVPNVESKLCRWTQNILHMLHILYCTHLHMYILSSIIILAAVGTPQLTREPLLIFVPHLSILHLMPEP